MLYWHPSSKQCRPFAGKQHSNLIDYPYGDPVNRQGKGVGEGLRTFLVIKTQAHLEEAAEAASRRRKAEHYNHITNLLSTQDFTDFLSAGQRCISLVLFSSAVCESCTGFHTFYAAMSITYKDRIKFGELDVEVVRELAASYMGPSFFIPAVLVFDRQGYKIASLSGGNAGQF